MKWEYCNPRTNGEWQPLKNTETQRAKVEGGYLYYRWSDVGPAMCFVPTRGPAVEQPTGRLITLKGKT